MIDWIVDEKPPRNDIGPFEVFVGGQVRNVRRMNFKYNCSIYFTDCIHPAQNIICDEADVVAWKCGL